VRVRNFKHKGLEKLFTEDSAKSVPAAAADKLRKMLTFMQDMQNERKCRRCRPGKPTH
jgi:proteic killer suppression protein